MLVLVKYGSVLFDMQKTQFRLDSVHNYRLPIGKGICCEPAHNED
jgi:hypothetical protein